MPEVRKYSQSEVMLILEHNARMIAHAKAGLKRYQQIPRHKRDISVSENIKYWAHLIAAYKLSDYNARRSIERMPNVNRSTI